MPKVKNPHVFLDISIDGGSSERITFELFANVVPKTAENFRALCTGERGLGASTLKPLYYKGTNIHRIVKGFVAQGGDFSRGDGRGGESIYGGKFPDENFRLMHDQPGVLSMANSGPDTNGSQFFITFKALPHLDGKHVVFGKVVSGAPLLKKLEALGTESGNPSRQVKIVDCGEVSDINSQDQLHGEKEEKLRKADGKSEGRVKPKKASSVDKQRRKRKHYSSDSYSSDSSDSRSYSSDESESYSSSSMDTSSSSDHRRKRRKGSKKDKRKPAKRKSKHAKSKRKSKGSKRRSRRSYGSSSDDSISSKTDNSSSDSENGGHHTKHSLRKDKESTKMAKSEQGRTLEDVGKGKQMVITDSQSHNAALSKDENGARDRSGNQNSEDRNDPGASSRISPTQIDVDLTKPGKADGNTGADPSEAGVSRISTEGNPSSNEPVATNGKNLAVGSADNGQPQRIRKGRGFTQKYGYARRYRTPSPERPPVRPRYDGGRNDRWNSFNRYGRNGPYRGHSPVQRYHESRYPRRDRSRSRSCSPVRRYDRGGYRRPSPRRSRSPAELPRRDGSSRPRPGHGDHHRGSSPPANRGRSRSRSKSRDPSRSRSPEAAPAKRESSKYNRRRSSSSRSSSPDGNKGLVSY